MNKRLTNLIRLKAFTLLELSISMGLLVVVGGIIYTVLNGGMILFSKNVATNYSNLAVRGSSQRLVHDIHEAVGRAELVGTNLQPASTLTAPGVRFPLLLNPAATRVLSDGSGSTTINSGASTSSVSVRIPQQPVAPRVGDIMVFPDINDLSGNTLTRTITAVTLGSPTVVTMKDLGVSLIISTDTPPDPTLVYIARLAAYALVGTEVRFYPDASNVSSYTVTNQNMDTYVAGGPFSIFSTGTSDPGNSVRVQMISINNDTGNRSFVGDRMVLSQIIPPKCLILQSTNYN